MEQEASRRGLKDKTIATLRDEDYDTIESLRKLTLDDMEYMKITRAQQGVLKEWIDDLNANQSSSHVTVVFGENDGTREVTEETVTVTKNVYISTYNFDSDVQDSVTHTTETNTTTGVYPSNPEPVGFTTETTTTTYPTNPAPIGFESYEIEVEDYIRRCGVKQIDNFLIEILSRYTKTPVNIAVTGHSGAGKSSFINCVRNLYGDDPGAATVGVKETTMVVQSYPDPRNPNIIYWDLPGIGTERFPRSTYLQVVDFNKYDFFLILSSERFKEDDLYLAKAVHDQGKQFYFLRTKIDTDISNDKRSRPRQHNEAELTHQVRMDCASNLNAANLPAQNVYIISSHLEDKAKYDFPLLMDILVKNAPEQKKSALVFSLNACSERGIEVKRMELERRIPLAAHLAALDERLVMSQNDRIIQEIHFYKKQFGLTDDDIAKMGVDRSTLTQRTTNVLGPAGNVLLTLTRGISSTAALPVRLIHNVTGLQKKNEAEIALYLYEALITCEQAAKEMLYVRRTGLPLTVEVTQPDVYIPPQPPISVVVPQPAAMPATPVKIQVIKPEVVPDPAPIVHDININIDVNAKDVNKLPTVGIAVPQPGRNRSLSPCHQSTSPRCPSPGLRSPSPGLRCPSPGLRSPSPGPRCHSPNPRCASPGVHRSPRGHHGGGGRMGGGCGGGGRMGGGRMGGGRMGGGCGGGGRGGGGRRR